MTFKEFSNWCNERAADGCWSSENALMCIHIIREFNNIPFWRREKVWRNSQEKLYAEFLQKFTKQKQKELGIELL